MITFERIDENLRFLVLEVQKQLDRTQKHLANPSRGLVDSVFRKEDYINNLKSIIHRKCYALAPAAAQDEATTVDMLQAFDRIAQNLERIADFCKNVVDQVRYVEDDDLLQQQDFAPFFDLLTTAVETIEQAVFERDLQAALSICRAEHKLDRLYSRGFHQVLDQLQELEKGESAQSLVTLIFILRYLERMGDALLNIGEAVISACLGESIKISRLRALEETLESAALGEAIADVSLKPVGETRSGVSISRVEVESNEEVSPFIFKEGDRDKLENEKKGSDKWQEVMPGLAPRIHAFNDEGDHGSLLFDYLPGTTFEEILIHGENSEVQAALERVCETLDTVWDRTRDPASPPQARFLTQLTRRLPDVYAVHPGFRRGAHRIGKLLVPSFEGLVEASQHLDELSAPFAVFGHGDFNVDNIIINAEEDQVHFIDLHRSRMLDYVQDVSVFLVSNHRLQVFEAPLRRRIGQVAMQFYDHARAFAEHVGDTTFDARLAVGLVRSYTTSTRFVLVPEFAQSMFLRARYLLELIRAQKDLEAFRLPREVLLD